VVSTPAAAPAKRRTTFSDGVFAVGADIEPGVYVTNGQSRIGGCIAVFMPRKSAPDAEAMPGAQALGATTYLGTSAGQFVKSLGGCTWTLEP
jgi:hypothetical protein